MKNGGDYALRIKMNNYAVITTINRPTKTVEALHNHFGKNIIIVADKKTPTDWNYNGITPIFESEKLYAPDNHYARKNLGYLQAIKNNADVIYDTDDDNIPKENFAIRSLSTTANYSNGEGWFNVYDIFSDEFIWPRGFSLKHISKRISVDKLQKVNSSIQQGLADGDPDVDAIWRLVLRKYHSFEINSSVCVREKSWCPFNSQSTWWFPKAYPLVYLPVYCSFRMTDIWRSFVAQRCLWEIGEGVTFHSPSEVFQDRNEHDLIKDFEDEIPGYLQNDLIAETLQGLQLKCSVTENMMTCYQSLVDKNIFPEKEIESLKQWIKDYENGVDYALKRK